MDLLNLFSTLRRHKIIVSVTLALIVAGCAYVVLGIPPQYQSQVQYVLIEPPPLPTDDQLKADPSLTKLNTNNPYLRLPNPSIVVDVLAQRVSADGVRNELIGQGADKDYTIASTDEIGSGLVIQVVGTGRSSSGSTRTLNLVVTRMKAELHDMQTVDGASDRYLFQPLPVSPPTPPTRKVTGTMRSLIAVGAAGIVLLFAAISLAEAVAPRRRRRTPSVPARQLAPADTPMASDRKNGETDLTVVLPRMVSDGVGESVRGKQGRD
jgi:capsular polysaccharide biosynthesis protein